MLIDDICDLLLSPAANHCVADVRVGLGYTAVQLDDGRCGLAYTFRDDIQEGCCVIKAAGTGVGRGRDPPSMPRRNSLGNGSLEPHA
jgi:hypothetical protein